MAGKTGKLSPTAERALQAYGGEKMWRQAKFLEAEVSTGGLLFLLKRRPVFRHARLLLSVQRPEVWLRPIDRKEQLSGVLSGGDVRLEDASGETVDSRKDARRFFPYGRRLLYWDDLDLAYFAGYAFWNYLTFPNLLLNSSISWAESAPGILDAEFPDSIPTHSRRQRFFFDTKSGLLQQHNYVAEVVSPLASAAHCILEHQTQDGLCFPSRRAVTPAAGNGQPRKRPLLVSIEVHGLKLR
ncbi:MAG: hypothetical protein K1X75_07210 [Leptospirales bacterium]|nr:hypothetical protein [Leptospirales bacterium]